MAVDFRFPLTLVVHQSASPERAKGGQLSSRADLPRFAGRSFESPYCKCLKTKWLRMKNGVLALGLNRNPVYLESPASRFEVDGYRSVSDSDEVLHPQNRASPIDSERSRS